MIQGYLERRQLEAFYTNSSTITAHTPCNHHNVLSCPPMQALAGLVVADLLALSLIPCMPELACCYTTVLLQGAMGSSKHHG
jgi:hypothetical protein